MPEPLSESDAYLAVLPRGAALVVQGTASVTLHSSVDAAMRRLLRDGFDYFVTIQNTDTGDEMERWIPLLDPRRDEEEPW